MCLFWAWKMAHLTCPAWKSDGHRSSFRGWNQPQGDRCDRAFSGRNGIPDILPEHHGKGSRKHQTPPLGWHQSDSRPSTQPFKTQANNHRTFSFKDSFQIGFTLCDSYPDIILFILSRIYWMILLMNSAFLKHWKVCPESPTWKYLPAQKENPPSHPSVMSKGPYLGPRVMSLAEGKCLRTNVSDVFSLTA